MERQILIRWPVSLVTKRSVIDRNEEECSWLVQASAKGGFFFFGKIVGIMALFLLLVPLVTAE